MIHTVQWQTASPLWSEALQDENNKRFRQPALLRFASDTFMDELMGALNTDPALLPNFVACYETWRDEAAGWLADADFDPDQLLKLYQPAHQRFYLVAANLVCRLPGLPDKPLDVANEEKVSFVLRRLVSGDENGDIQPSDPTTFSEYGWFASQGWQKLDYPGSLADGEQRLPMFALAFCENGRKRRLLAGFLPVAGRETYQAAPAVSPPSVPAEDLTAEDPLADPRLAEFETTVVTGMLGLREAINTQIGFDPNSDSVIMTNAQAREIFVFALLDLMTFFEKNLPKVWQAVRDDSSTGLSPGESNLFNRLEVRLFSGSHFWDEVLRDVWGKRSNILLGDINDPDVGLTFLIDNLNMTEIMNAIDGLGVSDKQYTQPNSLNTRIKTALGTYTPPKESASETEAPRIDPNAGAVYAVRCVYERPRCEGVFTPLVSAPSQAFQLASFFDPDAPARPIRITMPIDTSIAGLRKFPKNVSFLISDQLRRQIERMRGLTLEALDKGELNDELDIDVGMICSLSIPIITICALILLMIIVQLLNIVFWWLPFFKICFPLDLKAR